MEKFANLIRYVKKIIKYMILNTVGLFIIVLSLGTLFGPAISGIVNSVGSKEPVMDTFIEGFKHKFWLTFRFSLIVEIAIVLMVVNQVSFLAYLPVPAIAVLRSLYMVILYAIIAVSIYFYILKYRIDGGLYYTYLNVFSVAIYKFPQTFIIVIVNILVVVVSLLSINVLLIFILPLLVAINKNFINRVYDTFFEEKKGRKNV